MDPLHFLALRSSLALLAPGLRLSLQYIRRIHYLSVSFDLSKNVPSHSPTDLWQLGTEQLHFLRKYYLF